MNGLKKLRARLLTYKRSPYSLFLFIAVCLAALICAAATVFIVAYILIKGIPHITPDLFAWKYTTENVSLMPALINTLFMIILSLLISVPIGIGSAIYLAEYAGRGNKLVGVVRVTGETLSGIPSIVYGSFRLAVFRKVSRTGAFADRRRADAFGHDTAAYHADDGEALLAVPDSYREGSFGLGAGKRAPCSASFSPTHSPVFFPA